MTHVDTASDRAVFRQIADRLRTEITAGDLVEGARLPSESDLMRAHGTARETVRRALGLLKSEGLIVTEHGRGAFVRRRHAVIRRRPDGAGTEGRDIETLSVSRIKADAVLAGQLNIRTRSGVLARVRRYLDDGEPVEIATSYIPWRLAGGNALAETDPGPGGLYARLAEIGHPVERFTEDLSARMPSPDEARALRLAEGVPVFAVVRIAHDQAGAPVEAVHAVMAGDRFILSYDLPTGSAR